jgi:hypothetical protein
MSKLIKAIQRYEIKYKGQFSFEMLYKLMYMWFYENGFKDEDGAGDKIEHLYYEKRNTNGTKELWIWWRVNKPESPYFTYKIRIECHVLNLKEIETLVEGQKVKTSELTCSIFFDAHLVYNDGKLDITKNWFTNLFQDYFFRTIHRKQVEDKKNELYRIAHNLINNVKQHLGLLMDVQLTKPFHNAFGVPQLR